MRLQSFLRLIPVVFAASGCVPLPREKSLDLHAVSLDVSQLPVFFISNDRSLLLRGDGAPRFVEGSSSAFPGWSRYKSGECGVFTRLDYSTPGSTGDALLRGDPAVGHECAAARVIRLTLAPIESNGSVRSYRFERATLNVDVPRIHAPASTGSGVSYIAVGFSADRDLAISDDEGECGHVWFGGAHSENDRAPDPMPDLVLVTRTDPSTWLVQTRPDELDSLTMRIVHHDKALCEADRRLYHLPLMFVVRMPRIEGIESQRAVRQMTP